MAGNMVKRNGRYQTQGSIEDQSEPGSRSGVLENLCGIKTKKQMNEAENYALMTVLTDCVEKYSANHSFTAKDLSDIHKNWLGGIYSWAGMYRHVDIRKELF